MKIGESSSLHTSPCAVVESVPSAVKDQRTATAHPLARARNHFSIEIKPTRIANCWQISHSYGLQMWTAATSRPPPARLEREAGCYDIEGDRVAIERDRCFVFDHGDLRTRSNGHPAGAT